MALNRVLTSAEREQLQAYPAFAQQASWAVRDFAVTWTDDTTTAGLVGQVGYNRWALNRWFSADLLFSNSQDTNIGLEFAILSKNTPLWDSSISQFDPKVCVDNMIAGNLFASFVQAYVTIKTKQYIF